VADASENDTREALKDGGPAGEASARDIGTASSADVFTEVPRTLDKGMWLLGAHVQHAWAIPRVD
jgi:hypothetical protein